MCHQDVGVCIVVDIAGADALAPAGVPDAGFLGDIIECESATVAIEMMPGLPGLVAEPVSVHEEQVHQTVVVVIEYRHTRPGRLDDILLALFRP